LIAESVERLTPVRFRPLPVGLAAVPAVAQPVAAAAEMEPTGRPKASVKPGAAAHAKAKRARRRRD
jgi:hypothetical protein